VGGGGGPGRGGVRGGGKGRKAVVKENDKGRELERRGSKGRGSGDDCRGLSRDYDAALLCQLSYTRADPPYIGLRRSEPSETTFPYIKW